MVWKSLLQRIEFMLAGKAKQTGMVKQPQPRYGDLIITKVAGGFLVYRPPILVLDDSFHESHTPRRVAT